MFNFRFWESLTFNNSKSVDISVMSGLKTDEDNSYEVMDEDNAYIELKNINADVKNLYLDFELLGDSPSVDIPIQIAMTDAGNREYSDLQSTEIVPNISESKYVRLHLIGKSEKIKIRFLDSNSKFKIHFIGINEKRPFIFRIWRVFLLMLITLLVLLFRPKSSIYNVKLDLSKNIHKYFIIGGILLQVGFFVGVVYICKSSSWMETTWKADLQYNYLAESFLDGHTYLDFDPPKVLSDLDNPFDMDVRNQALEQSGESIIWDLAYANGRYYSYFGIMPVLLFYLPYLIITGKALYSAKILALCSVLFVLSSFWFIYVIIKKFYRKTSLGMYLLMSSVLIAGSGIIYSVQKLSIYEVPILMALLLDLFGITCWLNAVDEAGRIHKRWLVIGAISIALVMGCRPQLAIALLFAFPIFWQQIKERKFFSIAGIWNTLCVILPFVIVGLGLCWYNWIRFGSPFDFGATYNLTGFDMTHRGFVLDRYILGIFEYFFQPFNVGTRFPYITAVAGHMGLQSDYQGQIINEPLLGGFFAFNLIGIFLFFIRKMKKNLTEKNIYSLAVFSTISGIMIVAVDIQMVGMTLRYLMDFSMFLMIPVIIIIMAMLEESEYSPYKPYVLTGIVILCALCVFTNYYTLLAEGRYNQMRTVNPNVFYSIKYELFSILSIR